MEDRCLFRLSGPDRVRFLNGQVTNDVAKLEPGESLAACLCSIKGKVEALVWIHQCGEAILLDGEAAQREFLQARLNRYLIADDCEIEDLTDDWVILHHFDPSCGGVRSRRQVETGWDLLLPVGEEVPLSTDRQIPESEWALGEIQARIPRSGCEITGNEFPSELGLDAWAVDFHKGCYLGQEIVSRIRSVGRTKRQLAAILASEPLEQGDALVDHSGNRGRATRKTLKSGEKVFQGLALFEDDGVFTGSVEIQRVVTAKGVNIPPI